MQTIMLSLIVPVAFFAVVVLVWLAIQLLAINRLGERKQGCKGPVPGENGEMLCCKGDGTRCEEVVPKVDQG
jgi:hypothetical protein